MTIMTNKFKSLYKFIISNGSHIDILMSSTCLELLFYFNSIPEHFMLNKISLMLEKFVFHLFNVMYHI